MGRKLNWDGAGIITSVICAVHCVLLPLLANAFPFFGNGSDHNLSFEWLMIAFAFFIGVYALVHGYKTHHRKTTPIIMFTTGFLFLIAKQFFHSYEAMLLVPGVILIISAHFINYRLCTRSKCTSPHHSH